MLPFLALRVKLRIHSPFLRLHCDAIGNPNQRRKGSSVIFKVTDKGVLFLPCEITERDTYTQEEWGKIKRLVAERGKSYKTSKEAREHLKSL